MSVARRTRGVNLSRPSYPSRFRHRLSRHWWLPFNSCRRSLRRASDITRTMPSLLSQACCCFCPYVRLSLLARSARSAE
jgi:hypothetical protein